jgi:hypothetical protein
MGTTGTDIFGARGRCDQQTGRVSRCARCQQRRRERYTGIDEILDCGCGCSVLDGFTVRACV